MKLKLFLAGILSMFLIFTACDSDDPVSVIDIDPDTEEPEPDDEEPEIDPLLVDTWKMDPTAGSLAVGPSADEVGVWFSISAGDVSTRDCFYDDLYIFNEDGTFENELGEETWVEEWQDGVEEDGCGTPVPPHDGSEAGNWSADGESVTVSGEGAFIGIAKVHNDGEDGNPSGNTITYDYTLSEDNTILEVTISGWLDDNPDATWYYRLTNDLEAGNDDDGGDDSNAEPANSAPAPSEDEENVLSLFSDQYNDLAVNTWRTEWSEATLEDIDLFDNPTKKYTDLNFVGIETTAENLVDASEMDFMHIDLWTPNMDVVRIKLVDFGDDGEFEGGDDTEHELVFEEFNTGEWNSLKIPLSDFEGLENRSNLAQYILSGTPAGTGVLYVDNVYFSQEP